MDQRQAFEDFEGRRYMLLTTFRRDGTPVPSPVGAYNIDGRLFFLTDPRSAKARRMRRNPHVTIAPCSIRGAPIGPTRHARVRATTIVEAEELANAFAHDHPITFRLGRLLCDLRNETFEFYELLPTASVRRVA